MKKTLGGFLLAFAFLFGLPAYASAYGVQIAPFYTQIGSMSVDNRYVKYPLITYNDVTYFPMTYDLCQMLNLRTGFDKEKGLYIASLPTWIYSETEPQPFGDSAVNKRGKKYAATSVNYPVYLNGVQINAAGDEAYVQSDYPLLNFRGITYFPMTWKLAHEELNFNINWDEENYAFYLTSGDKYDTMHPYEYDEDGLYLEKCVDTYSEEQNENGDTVWHRTGRYYDYCKLNYADESISFLGRFDGVQSFSKNMFRYVREFGSCLTPEPKTVESKLYAGDTFLYDFGETTIYSTDCREYVFDDCSLITATVQTTNAPAPYTKYEEYWFLIKNDTVTKLDINPLFFFNGAVKCEDKIYIITNGYRPVGSGRWSTSVSNIFVLDGAGQITPLTDSFPTLNSMQAIGQNGDCLYLEGIWYEVDELHQVGVSVVDKPISVVNSGYYEYNMKTGEMTKLYPYVYGNPYLTNDGRLYLFTKNACEQRIVNLLTGKIIPMK